MQKLKEYTKHPGSFIVFILIILATIITVGTMLFLVAYILLKGIPNITPQLFEWEYNSDNVSMMPAIINTVLMTGATLLMAVPIGVFSAVYLAEYAKKGSKLVKLIRVTVETPFWIPCLCCGAQMGIFVHIRIDYARDNGSSSHNEDYGGSDYGCTGFL